MVAPNTTAQVLIFGTIEQHQQRLVVAAVSQLTPASKNQPEHGLHIRGKHVRGLQIRGKHAHGLQIRGKHARGLLHGWTELGPMDGSPELGPMNG
jgi:hypothetical protein